MFRTESKIPWSSPVPTLTATTNGRWLKSTFDGFGRTTMEEITVNRDWGRQRTKTEASRVAAKLENWVRRKRGHLLRVTGV